MHTSSDASKVESNWVKSCSSDLRHTFARTFSLPLCGIPIMILSTPNSLDLSMIVFIAGINTSQPSRPKRFSELHFLARNASNLSCGMFREKKECKGKTGQVRCLVCHHLCTPHSAIQYEPLLGCLIHSVLSDSMAKIWCHG